MSDVNPEPRPGQVWRWNDAPYDDVILVRLQPGASAWDCFQAETRCHYARFAMTSRRHYLREATPAEKRAAGLPEEPRPEWVRLNEHFNSPRVRRVRMWHGNEPEVVNADGTTTRCGDWTWEPCPAPDARVAELEAEVVALTARADKAERERDEARRVTLTASAPMCDQPHAADLATKMLEAVKANARILALVRAAIKGGVS